MFRCVSMLIVIASMTSRGAKGFVTHRQVVQPPSTMVASSTGTTTRTTTKRRTVKPFRLSAQAVEFDDLMDMDVVIYSTKKNEDTKKYLGAMQEDGTLAPLSAWSTEPVFDESIEFLVDEEDRFPGLSADQVIVHSLIPQESLCYSSRQVGGGKGPGNPHGEESEILYQVDQSQLEGIEIKINPDLEILW